MQVLGKKKLLACMLATMLGMHLLPGSEVSADSNQVKNVIVLMMDGSNASQATVARWYKGAPLSLDEMYSGAVRTYGAESIITDSAPAATAFATGHKTSDKFIGIMPDKVTIPVVPQPTEAERMKPVASVLEGARLNGKAVGLVATSNIQHASPASYSAHWPDRNNYNEIAEQQVYENIDVVLSGGTKYLLPAEQAGMRTDHENLVDVLKAKGYAFVQTQAELAAIKQGKVWGTFADADMAYEFDRRVLKPEQPSLADMTGKAIELLSKNQKGFFLFVEGSKVDWAAHANDPIGTVSDMLAFDDAVKRALDFAKKDGHTLVLAFADHANGGMTIGSRLTNNTYSKLPLENLTVPLKKATLTGEGIEKVLGDDHSAANITAKVAQYYGVDDLSEEEISSIQKAKEGEMNYALGPIISKRAALGWTTNGHTGEDVFLFSYGPNRPVGLIDNTDIAKLSAKALGFNLDDVDKKLFVEAAQAFAKLGAAVSIDKQDPANPVLVVTKGAQRAELPFSKNILRFNGKVYELPGLTVLAPLTGKAYVPEQAVALLQEHGF